MSRGSRGWEFAVAVAGRVLEIDPFDTLRGRIHAQADGDLQTLCAHGLDAERTGKEIL